MCVAPGAGFEELQLMTFTLFKIFSRGSSPVLEGVILTTPSITMSGVFSECSADVSSFQTFKPTVELPVMLKSPFTVRYFMQASSFIVTFVPALSPIVARQTPEASPPKYIIDFAPSLPISTLPSVTSGCVELNFDDPNTTVAEDVPPENVKLPIFQYALLASEISIVLALALPSETRLLFES